MSQLTEKLIPADFIFYEKSLVKIFGLQYKALYQSKNTDDYWKLDERQHEQLQKFDWIYYCFSELKSYKEHRVALHKCIFKDSNFEFIPKILARQAWAAGKRGYYRWAGFFDKFLKCKLGMQIHNLDRIASVIQPNSDFNIRWIARENLIDIFLTELNSKRIIHYSPFFTVNIQEQ